MEAAALAVALPGVIDLLFEYGEWIWKRVKTFKNAEGVWAELGQFGWSLSHGELNSIIVTAKSFYLEEGCDPGVKRSLELQIYKLDSDVKATREFLEKKDPAHHLGLRILFTILGEGRAKELNKQLKADKQQLALLLMINDIKTRRVPEPILLTSKRFLHHQSIGYQPVSSTTNLFITRGDYRENLLQGSYHEVTVIIERNVINEQGLEDALKEIAAFLHYRIPDQNSSKVADGTLKGILPCLGYRMKPTPELIFEMPEGTQNPRTLHDLIAVDQGVVRHPLDFKFRLARRLSEAVLRVHTAQLVHKNIRTNTILVLQPIITAADNETHYTSGFGDVYLTNWRLLRDFHGPTMQSRGNQWTEDLYRHPKRQGIHVEERYNMGHDIYSLGVCLLEIGLWDLLVHKRPADGQPQVSKLFRDVSGVDSHPDPEAELRAKLSHPNEVKNILLKIGKENLPQRLGLEYHRLVAACLTGLDQPSGFGPEVDFTKMNMVEQGLAFKELVLSYFTEMSI